jgi:glyoxylase-like metal-dependent hydrolase (beta-lactamase superfamily II)
VTDSPPGHPEILRVIAPNPGPMTLEGTNTYLVGEGPVYVIDPGPADPGHAERVRELAEGRGGLAGVLLTHTHGDHAGALELLEADVIEAGPFERLPTPGHAADHACFLSDGVCFSGDLVLGEGSTFVPPDGGSLAAYLDSLRRLRERTAELICPGHGPYVTDPRAKIEEYLDHRLERERKLVAALDAGERSRARLLAAAWDDVPVAMRPAAAVVMEAHLQKLDAEGRLPRDLRE